MKPKINARWIAQSIVVLVCGLALKQYYSTATADQLKWILTPTTVCVEVLGGESFEFESHAGYMSSDHRFLIAASCAGVNFLLTTFVVLTGRRLLFESRDNGSWAFLPGSLLAAYVVTVIANTTRILLALQLQRIGPIGWLDSSQLHLLEGILVYFLFLSLLFLVSDRKNSDKPSSMMRRCLLPLLAYYATMLAIPLLNGAYGRGRVFWEYSIVVLLVPMIVTAVAAGFNTWHVRNGQTDTMSRIVP